MGFDRHPCSRSVTTAAEEDGSSFPRVVMSVRQLMRQVAAKLALAGPADGGLPQQTWLPSTEEKRTPSMWSCLVAMGSGDAGWPEA